jgi:hypothetical protein
MHHRQPFLRPLLALLALGACGKDPGPKLVFETQPQVRVISPAVDELSGLASSARYPGHIWGQEDGGNPADLLLIREDGSVVRRVRLRNAVNRDWEEVARAGSDLYVADIGDNNGAYPDYRIHVLPEPAAGVDTADIAQTIRFTYPDGAHDAEAFLVDPVSRDIYLITKRDNPARIYRLAAPYSTGVAMTQLVGTLPFSGITAASLASDGSEILVRGYFNLYYFSRNNGETIAQALARAPQELRIQTEPQGEAVCLLPDRSGFITGTEKGMGSAGQLYFYRRL